MSRESMKKMDKPQPQHRQAKTQAEQKSGIERIVQHYLESNPLVPNAGKTSELELRFGTNPRISKPISKIDYDNVVKRYMLVGLRRIRTMVPICCAFKMNIQMLEPDKRKYRICVLK